MDCCAADLDSDGGVESRDGGLEGLEGEGLVGEDAELGRGDIGVGDTESDAGVPPDVDPTVRTDKALARVRTHTLYPLPSALSV